MIREIIDVNENQTIARRILESLPNWFGIEESREEYIVDCSNQLFFAYIHNGSQWFTCRISMFETNR